MGWIIALVSVGAYFGTGLMLVPSLTRHRWRIHVERGACSTIGCYYRDSEKKQRGCSADWASWAWLLWPFVTLVSFPRDLASKAMEEDVQAAKRLKKLEKEAEEQDKRKARELAILRANDPATMTVEDFERKMLEAGPTLAKGAAPNVWSKMGKLQNPFT